MSKRTEGLMLQRQARARLAQSKLAVQAAALEQDPDEKAAALDTAVKLAQEAQQLAHDARSKVAK